MSPTWGRGLAGSPGEEPQPSWVDGGGGAWLCGPPRTQAGNYVGLACSSLRRASWKGFLPPARRESCVLQPRELLSEIRRHSTVEAKRGSLSRPGRANPPGGGAEGTTRGTGTGTRLGATVSV